MLGNIVTSLIFAVTLLSAAQAVPVKRASVCNGHAELCSRSYANVTYVGAHDSFAFSVDPFALARDQAVDIPTQLKLGARLLQAQSHMNGNDLHFCHTSCLLFDGGKVSDYLTKVKTFLDANPNEVLTLLFTNPEGVSVKDVWKPLFDGAGITPLTYVPPTLPLKQSDWPTLGEMIDSGKRVVVFMDADSNTTAVDFILPEFEMIWETPFSVTNASFSCSVDRIHGPLNTSDHMYMINHSLNKDLFDSGIIVTDPFDAPTTNGVESILAHVDGCAPLGGNRNPTFVLLDFIDKGNAFQAVNQLNGLPSPPNNSSGTGHSNAASMSRRLPASSAYIALSILLITFSCF